MQTVHFQDLGQMDYAAAWDYQETLMRANLDIKAKWYATGQSANQPTEKTTHHLLFCSHPHVYTLGKSGQESNLLVTESELESIGATFYRTNRGGDITYHGPGQIVGYPVLDLERFFTDLGRYMRSLEEMVIVMLRQWGIAGERLPGSTGVWLEPDTPRARKICAMGVKCSRWITIHGFALNVNADLRYFNHIVPCGITDKAVTSMQQELGYAVDESTVKDQLKIAFEHLFDARLVQYEPTNAPIVSL